MFDSNLAVILLAVVIIIPHGIMMWALFRLPWEQMRAAIKPQPGILWTGTIVGLPAAQVWLTRHHAASIWTLAAFSLLFFGGIIASVVFRSRRQKRLNLPAPYIKTVMVADLSWILCLAVVVVTLYGKAYFAMRRAEQLKQEIQESQRLYDQSQHP